ncbi:unnamed protein product [Scytosiphon promiscuus]
MEKVWRCPEHRGVLLPSKSRTSSVPRRCRQVEHVRLGIPTSTPLAVQQWDGLIAVNYEARKFGVKRGDRTAAAKQKCPQITLVHVETIGGDSAEDPIGGDGAGEGGGDGGEVAPAPGGGRHDQWACKVSLERYRTASFAIMAIFQAHCRRVERASIDEAYLDLTEEVAKICQEAEAGKGEGVGDPPETDLQGAAGHRVDTTSAFDRALLAGARLTAAMRLAVENELGFTVSAGIASNKVLAKLASSINKPNKQTVVPAGASSDMLDTVPVRKVRGLGGKLGEAVVSWSKAETASDLKRFSEQDLAGNFGAKTGEWLWRVCRGMDDEPVVPNLKPKSLSVCKSFAPVRDEEAVLKWMTLLCTELSHRIAVDREAWSRRATKLTLQMISLKAGSRANQRRAAGADGKKGATTTRSRTVDLPGEPPTTAALVTEAMALFTKTDNALPCSRLALTAHDFGGLVSGRGSIASFLRALPREEETQPAPTPLESLRPDAATPSRRASPVKYLDEGRDAGGERSVPGEEADLARGGEDLGVSGRRLARAATDAEERLRLGDRSSSSFERSDRVRSESSVARSPVRSGQQRCPKCEKNLAPEEDLQEHLDFHYAEGLQERYAREGDVVRDMAAKTSDRGGASKRSRHDVGGKGSKGWSKRPAARRIDSFFKPA